MLPVPYVPQDRDTCAAAALAMVLAYWERPIPQEAIAAVLLQPELRGIPGSRVADFARDQGLLAVAHKGDAASLRNHLDRGRPLIVAWEVGRGRYHDVVVIGFDPERKEYVVHDPARGASRRVRAGRFEKRWAGAGHWTLLVTPAPR